MESAGLAVRAGLDGALSDDGDGGLVGLEKIGVVQGVGVLWDSARFQCGLDSALFRCETTGLGTCGYHRDVGGDRSDDDCVFPSE